ncbi:MAG: dual OB domain-containing protein [Parvibaculales bacterium]
MPYRDIICLANSWREGGHCFAGKDVNTGEWIRPIGKKSDAIIENEQTYRNRFGYPKLLDIVRVPLEPNRTSNSSIPYQTENYRISGDPWEYAGKITWEETKKLVDGEMASLWGKRQSIFESSFEQYNNSLALIELPRLMLKGIKKEGRVKRQLRGVFQYAEYEYDLPITDLVFDKDNDSMKVGEEKRITENMLICVSLGGPYEVNGSKYASKLIAGIMVSNNARK